jgi:hypothetical protein
LHNITEAEQLVDWFHAQDPEEVQSQAVWALIGAGLVKGPWVTEVLHRVSTSIGVSPTEARAFIAYLETRGRTRRVNLQHEQRRTGDSWVILHRITSLKPSRSSGKPLAVKPNCPL